jgi:signal transduction histidine kinase
MIRERENYHAFLLHFLERLNSCDSIEKKITESLTDICEYYGFKKAFIYQTDGFRYFYLKETIGNNDNILRQRFEISEMSNQHIAHANGKSKPFYACRTQNASWDDVDIIDFYRVDSLLIRQIQDSEGKIIGFIGFADREHAISFIDEELQMIHLILGSLSKEIAVREYKEREVRASKTLSSIMNNMGVDIYVNSFDSHDMLYANESMAAPYGGIEHFEGKKCWQALYKDKTGECEFCPKKHLIDENGQPTKVYSWDYQRPFDKCWFRVFSAAFAWIDGQIAHVITSVDIDHQKTIEEELRIAKEKAENLDRLKSAFLANMSHEIRTPLNAIVGFASLLVESDDKKERQDYVDIMQENTELLLQLISDILDLSKIEAGTLDFTMDHLDIKSFCEDIMRNYDIKEDKPVPVLLTPDLPQYYIYTDKKRLMQVITNFINNALKFTNEGQITLEYHYKKESNEIEFAVTDTGMGIAPDKVNQVFDRFVKLNSFSKGTGLGLSICRSIIEHLGGTIGVESEMGTGSRFWFTHPLHLNQREKTKEIVSK